MNHIRYYSRRVVVTGLGALSPLGRDVPTSWSALLDGKSGVTSTPSDAGFEKLPCRVAAFINKPGEQPIFEATQVVSTSEVRTLSSASLHVLQAAEEALQDSQWKPSTQADLERTGVAIGMAMTDLDYIVDTGLAFRGGGLRKISPFFVPRILTNMASGAISLRYKFQGPNHSVATACATGIHAVGDAFQFIKYGKAEVMLCGGTECSISALSLAGFCRLRALSSKFNETPHAASRPFDKDRDGFIMGEGAAVLVLEELEHAKARGARIHGELLGYGLAADAHHITAASEDGSGAYLCMRNACEDAGLNPEQVEHVNAHATSTPGGDAAEAAAINRLFLNGAPPFVSATKSSTGHLLGAAGALETIFAVKAVSEGQVPPTLNADVIDEKCKGINLHRTATPWQSKQRRIALKNSFGFGGTNATLIVGQY
ncbi:3-oxoacyl-[acyl-carrier-protein] synthase, mitochondrial [Galendromus occidentalis]|uniref:3-oxoacyl-[acyl-carrier-protein] synthase n=1 Tax=Galendromus occidentalis TaxID=34638 RepID=A0AAJ6QY61_9ACAR|nr:3-oxoacyl-[acyl-carrier-protein] synthase, mitochondrial [Galendromus occidentalis]